MSDLAAALDRVDNDPEISLEDVRQFVKQASEHHRDWQGMPVPVDGLRVRLHEQHPLRHKIDQLNGVYASDDEPQTFACHVDESQQEVIVNSWRHSQRNATVYVVRGVDGKSRAFLLPFPPDNSMRRLMLGMQTMGAADAWTVDAEVKAMEKLQTMLTERQFRMYVLTGAFLERSPRSDVTYWFRKLRPTVAMTPRWRQRDDRPEPDSMRCLAVLCLHPVGYYEDSWAGCMTPTDDVIAHLLLMRADEAGYWGQANQHDPASAEAGL